MVSFLCQCLIIPWKGLFVKGDIVKFIGEIGSWRKIAVYRCNKMRTASSPHPPPAAGAGRHLPPKGKAFRGNPPLTYTRTFVFLCSIKQRTVSSGSLPPRGKVSPSKCGGRRMRGRQGYAIKQPDKPKPETLPPQQKRSAHDCEPIGLSVNYAAMNQEVWYSAVPKLEVA